MASSHNEQSRYEQLELFSDAAPQMVRPSDIIALSDPDASSSPLAQATSILNLGALPHREHDALDECLRRPDPNNASMISEAEHAVYRECDTAPLLLGIDEAGRGPWAGPVVAAAVVLPVGFGVSSPLPQELARLNDSKRLTERQRLQLIEPICRIALGVGIGISDASLIDKTSITQANYMAMYFAVVRALKVVQKSAQSTQITDAHLPILALVDGKYQVPPLTLNQIPMIKGDQRSYHIAAASVIAKVTRDKMMVAAHRSYPHYGFSRHKGYGTPEHQKALREHGPCPLHRYSFRPIKELLS